MTKPSTTPTQRSLREVIADDSHALTFQTLGQYRAALLKHDVMELAQHTEAFAWAVLAENNNVIIWSKNRAKVESASTKYGRPVLPVIALSVAQQAAAPVWGAVHTVGDMVRNLLTLDQAAPIFTALHVTIDGERRCRTLEVTISRERVVDGKWIDSARKDVPYTHIVWAEPDERAQQGAVLVAQEPVDHDLLPPLGSKVLIHLANQDAWVEHTVTGYYVWPALKHQIKKGEKDTHRVFVRVKDAWGYDNARLLSEVKAVSKHAVQLNADQGKEK
jgi:hypothetical protein